MHRGGTSLLAKILQQAGVFIGNDLDENNESQFFCNLNEWAFFQAGASWDNPYNMNFLTKNIKTEISANFTKRLSNRTVKKYHNDFKKLSNSNKLWAWKDPRNTFTAEIWQKVFPEAKVIHIHRNPIDVAESLKQRENQFQKVKDSQTKTGIKKWINEYKLVKTRIYSQSLRVNTIEEGVKLWKEYTVKAYSVKNNCLHISYENLIENSENQIIEILNFLNLKINNKNIDSIIEGINKTRKTAFLTSEKLINEYRKIQNTELVCKLKYDKLI